MGPSYKFETFIHECDSGEEVRVIDPALQTAPLDFGLTTEETILSFVAHEIESPTFINSKPLEWTNMGVPQPDVDAYSFYSNTTYGYLAFFYIVTNDTWFIKSLKRNRDPGPRLHIMRRAFQLGGFGP